MSGKANYVVVAIRASGVPTQIERTFKGAPSDTQIAVWMRHIDRGGAYQLAVRYYPSRKGWMIIDARNAFVRVGPRPGSPAYMSGTTRGTKVYPSESAAVMKAIHMLNLPVQQSLNL